MKNPKNAATRKEFEAYIADALPAAAAYGWTLTDIVYDDEEGNWVATLVHKPDGGTMTIDMPHPDGP